TAAITAPRRSKMKTFTIENETNNRSEEHTSELQSRRDLVCRLLLEKARRPLFQRQQGEADQFRFRRRFRPAQKPRHDGHSVFQTSRHVIYLEYKLVASLPL